MSMPQSPADRGHPCLLSRHLLHRLATLIIVTANLSQGICHVFAGNSGDKSCRPNIVIIVGDDLGYADIGPFGPTQGYATPNLDRMAAEGMKFTDFYVAQAVCSASRAALLTGCYSNRVGILGALGPQSANGINDDETTLGEVAKRAGYATAIYGKWHLGHHPRYLPGRHGFDDYFGLPYSNDMWPNHPQKGAFPDLPLIEGEKTIALNPDQSQLTTWYTERAVKFIDANKERPFLLYVPHSMPHVPIFASDKFAGKTERGLFGDVISEIDWSVGEILSALKRNGLDDKTLVIFTSDNGPWLNYGNHAGSAGPLREGKGGMWDGGCRVPCVMRWPGKIPAASVCNEPAMTIDVLPTVAKLLGVTLDSDRPIDGLDIAPLMFATPGAPSSKAKSPHEALWLYYGQELQAIRSGPWKLVFPHKYRHYEERGADGRPAPTKQGVVAELELYNLHDDVGETKNIAAEHPDVVAQLQRHAEAARAELGDSLQKRVGRGNRKSGQLKS